MVTTSPDHATGIHLRYHEDYEADCASSHIPTAPVALEIMHNTLFTDAFQEKKNKIGKNETDQSCPRSSRRFCRA
jgi:hypothetical protein